MRDRTLNLGLRYHSPSSLLFRAASLSKATLSARFKSVKCFDQKTKGKRMLPLGFLVEVTGLEPAASCSQSKRATIAPHLVMLLYSIHYANKIIDLALYAQSRKHSRSVRQAQLDSISPCFRTSSSTTKQRRATLSVRKQCAHTSIIHYILSTPLL